MKPRSVIMDISIDQGGCVETSRPTTYQNPTYIEEGVIHYCVPNMTGVVARTTTHAINNAAWPYIREIAEKGTGRGAGEPTPRCATALNTHNGEIVHPALREVAGGCGDERGGMIYQQQALLRRRRGAGDQVAQPRLHDRQLQRAEGAAGRAGAPGAGAGGRGDRPGAHHRPGRLRRAGDGRATSASTRSSSATTCARRSTKAAPTSPRSS